MSAQPPSPSVLDLLDSDVWSFSPFHPIPLSSEAGEPSPVPHFPSPELFCSEPALSPSPAAAPAAAAAASAAPRGSCARHWCFTLNHFADDELADLASLCVETQPGHLRYLVVGREVGETGTPHLQGYLELKSKQFLTWLRDHVSSRAHFEPRRGTREEARDYCMKDGDWLETGEWKEEERGRRRDIERMVEQASQGVPFYEACVDEPTSALFPHAYCKLLEGRALQLTQAWREVTVEVQVGGTGVGKTRSVYDRFWPDLFAQDCSAGGEPWWDGYNGQKTLLLDDFDGRSIPFRYLLRLTDGYPIRVRVKGAFTYGAWERVCITSNLPVMSWYPRERDMSPLFRRITELRRFDSRGDVTCFHHSADDEAFL